MSTDVQYTLVFKNQSRNPGSVMVFQQDPGYDADVFSLAWLTKFTFPTTTVTLNWEVNYSFVWSETGLLHPGVLFTAAQNWPADLSTSNEVTFIYDGGYTFTNQRSGPQPGSLFIDENGTIRHDEASVGIGMSGAGTFAVQAQPNINLKFTPHPQYWIAFGNYTTGEVLDVQEITNPAQIEFPPNIYSMTAILTEQNEWIIEPTSMMNRALVEARKKDPKAVWGVAA